MAIVDAFVAHTVTAFSYRQDMISQLADRLRRTAETYEDGDERSESLFDTLQDWFR